MKRRQFITLLGGAAVAWPIAARAQQLSKLPQIGFLQRVRNENVVAFIQALRDAGYVDGQNAVIETRIFETTLDRVPDFAKELVDLKCDVILAASQYAFVAAMKATTTIPIVGLELRAQVSLSIYLLSSRLPYMRPVQCETHGLQSLAFRSDRDRRQRHTVFLDLGG